MSSRGCAVGWGEYVPGQLGKHSPPLTCMCARNKAVSRYGAIVLWKRPVALALPESLEASLADLGYALQPKTLLPGNRLALLRDGGETYPAMLAAIAKAASS